MAGTLMTHYGFNQFVGYTVPTWYGKGGWGTLGTWQSQQGRYSLAEAWFFNNQAIIFRLLSKFPEIADDVVPVREGGTGMEGLNLRGRDRDAAGMLWDRDVVAFYGDPAMRVVVGRDKGNAGVDVKTKTSGEKTTVTIRPKNAKKSLEGKQTVYVWLPRRLQNPTVIEGDEFQPVVTDDLLMVTKPQWEPGGACVVVIEEAAP
jgi:zinc protease